MIKVSDTKKYTVNPKDTIERAFEGSYVNSLEKMPSSPPDYISAIWGAASIVFVALLYYITAVKATAKSEDTSLWYALSAVCVAIPIIVIYRLLKSHKAFKNASGGENKKETERKRFYALMNYDVQPAEMSATEFSKFVNPMLCKQTKELYNSAIRRITEYLAKVNNPTDLSCKLLTPFGNVFNQPKKRFYFSVNDDTVTFTDFDFASAKREITCDISDMVSFGPYSKFTQGIPSAGGKIKPDAVILEVQDGTNHLYFEFLPQDMAKLKKAFSSKKEIK